MKRKDPWQLLVIASFCFLIGGTMLMARRGELRPAPASQQGTTPDLAALSAPDVRAYGWFGIVCGLASVGFYFYLRPKPREW